MNVFSVRALATRPAVRREDKRLAVGNRHIQILRLVTNVSRQSRGELKPADLSMRFFGPRQQGAFVTGEIAKNGWLDSCCRRVTQGAKRFRFNGIGFARDDDDVVGVGADGRIQRRHTIRDEDITRQLGVETAATVLSGKKIVRLVQKDFMGQPRLPPERHERRK